MSNLPGGPRFPLKSGTAVGIGSKITRQNFQSDVAIQTRITRPIHLSHSACAEWRKYFVRPELCPGRQRHKCGIIAPERFSKLSQDRHATARKKLANGFLASDVERHKDLDGDTTAALTQIIGAKHLAQRLAIEGAGSIRIREGDEDAHALFVRSVFGCEIYAISSRVQRGKDLIELEMRLGRAHANDLRQFQAGSTPALWWIGHSLR